MPAVEPQVLLLLEPVQSRVLVTGFARSLHLVPILCVNPYLRVGAPSRYYLNHLGRIVRWDFVLEGRHNSPHILCTLDPATTGDGLYIRDRWLNLHSPGQ